MRKPNAIRTAALAVLVAASFSTVPAAGPFQVRRASSAQAVATAPPVATVATSPYDGEPVAVGGPSYDYAVYDASGNALDISVQTNPVTHTLRIGFDDANAASAAVDAAATSLAVAPASIRADGLQLATITIAPRDANGVLLGRGLSVAIDASLLWPAQLTGPVADLGNGSYVATAAATAPGTGSVRVSVEGVVLAVIPAITATPVDPSASPRDLAISDLQGLAGAGGPLAALAAQAGAGTRQAAAINAAIADANNALSMLANDGPTHDDNALKTVLDSLLSELAGVLASPGTLDPLDVRDAMDDIVGVARMIAQWHMDLATAACGICDGSGNPRKVCNGAAAMANADAMRAAVSPDWSAIVDTYAWAIEMALQSLQSC